MRRAAAVLLFAAALALAGCAAGPTYQSYGGSYGSYGGGYLTPDAAQSNCGATGTCAPSSYPRIVPGDEHGD